MRLSRVGRVDTRQREQVQKCSWPQRDVAAISALYADGASWQQHPFRDPEAGYLARVFGEEKSAECRFGVPLVDGDQATMGWNAQTKLMDNGTEDVVRVSLLRFGTDGLCRGGTRLPEPPLIRLGRLVLLRSRTHFAALRTFSALQSRDSRRMAERPRTAWTRHLPRLSSA